MDERYGHLFDDVEAWLCLRHCRKIPISVALTLAQQLGGAQEVLNASTSTLQRISGTKAIGHQKFEAFDKQAVRNDIKWLQAGDHHYVIPFLDRRYPQLLRELSDPPLLLYAKGNPKLLLSRQLAIVGSRNPTPTGRELAFRFSASLTRSGFTTTSGMALGIDAAAHQGALSVSGSTIAVVATGLDRIYPARHQHLAQQIAHHGVLISELPVGTQPRRQAFPQRNRIISGLCFGTLVVEATKNSGSLITARLAGEQGREVFTIPGSVLSPQSRGCHTLLRDGAILVESEADILVELGSLDQPASPPEQTKTVTNQNQGLIHYMGYDPVTIDTLVHRSGLTVDKVCSMLSHLEMQGVVKAIVGGYYIRVES